MKKAMVLFVVLIFLAAALPVLSGTRFGGTHTKRQRIVACYVDGAIIQTRKKDCKKQGGKILTQAEAAKLRESLERQEGM